MLKKLCLFLLVSVLVCVPISEATNTPHVIQTGGSISSSTVRPQLILPPAGSVPNGYETPWTDKEGCVPEFQTLATTYGGDWESIGKSSSSSFGGNSNWDIAMFKFGNPDGGVVMIDAQMHGNEFYGYQVLKAVVTWMLSSSDADAVRIRERNCLLIVPVVNYRMARTNFRVQSSGYNDYSNDGGRVGVNLNRNFGPSWSSGGSATDSYSGPSADSEAESQALVNAWNLYHPRIYWNLHQGSGPSTMCTARTTQATADANTVDSLLPSIQSSLGLTSGWSFNVGSSYSSGFSKDGAASRGSAGFLTEVSTGWDANPTIKASLETGNIFKNVKAMVIAMCQAVESTTPSLSSITGQSYINSQDSVLTTPTMCLSDGNLQFKFVEETGPADSKLSAKLHGIALVQGRMFQQILPTQLGME